jgi:hypothetical protein
MPIPTEGKDLGTSLIRSKEDYLTNQLLLLLCDRYELKVNDHQIVLRTKPNTLKGVQMYLQDNQMILLALANSYWTNEKYCILNLYTTYFVNPTNIDFMNHKIAILRAKPTVFSASCQTYTNEKLIAESSIVCEGELPL